MSEFKPPSLCFVPDTALLRIMITAVSTSEHRHECLIKFHDMEKASKPPMRQQDFFKALSSGVIDEVDEEEEEKSFERPLGKTDVKKFSSDV